jgi:hypothetical protein
MGREKETDRKQDEERIRELISGKQKTDEGGFGLIETIGIGLWLLVFAGAALFVIYRFLLT